MNNIKDITNVKMISIVKLASNREYQRPINWTWINKTAKEFDKRLFGFLKVFYNHAEDNYVVIEGQHRTLLAGKVGLTEVPCEIIEIETVEEAADMFANSHNMRKPAYKEIFRALCFAGDEDCLNIVGAIKTNGFVLNADAVNGIRCISALKGIYDKCGYLHLCEVLRLLKLIWEGDKRTLVKGFVNGFSLFLKTYQGELPLNSFINKFYKIPVLRILENATLYKQMGNSVTKAYALTFVTLYNKGKSTKKLEEIELIGRARKKR